MSDRMTSVQRGALMSRIKSEGTGPEFAVRRLVHGLGYRYVANDRRLPGSPDLAFISRRRVILVHGCFWHAHDCGRGFRPVQNAAFWEAKLLRNVTRDHKVVDELAHLGWGCLVVYECELKPHLIDEIAWRIIAFLEDDASPRHGGA